MKNLKRKTPRLLWILFVLVFLHLSCTEARKEEEKENKEVKPPSQIVSVAKAKTMYDNYTERRVPLIQRYEDSINGYKKKFDVARYVSYDYATMKQYMAYIEQEAKLANVDISTIRFYFSNYPDSSQYVHPRQNSILLSPTVKKENRDYLFYIGSFEGQSMPILLNEAFGPLDKGLGEASMKKSKAYASFVPNTNIPFTLPYQGGKSVTMNSGTGVPPPYN